MGTALSAKWRFGFQPPSGIPVGRSKLQTGRRQVHRCLKSRENVPPLPFLALGVVRELFCIVSNLIHLDLCFFKFCLGRDVREQQLHRVVGVQPLLFIEALQPAAVLGLLLGLTDTLRFWLLPARLSWRVDTSSPASSPDGMIPAPEGKGVEQAVSWGVGWGQLYVLGRNGRRYVY